MTGEQKMLISEQETTGVGDLYRGAEYLGKCEYHLKFRRSRLKIQKTWPDLPERVREYLITTIMGTLTLSGEPGETDREKHVPLILHLNDDYLVPLSATHAEGRACKVVGRLVAQPKHGDL